MNCCSEPDIFEFGLCPDCIKCANCGKESCLSDSDSKLFFPDEETYYRKNFGNTDCPACGATLDETGRKHADGTKCEP